MKNIKLALIAAAVLAAPTAFAQATGTTTTTATFNVKLTLTPTCYISQPATSAPAASLTDISIPYTAFQTTASTGSTAYVVRCSDGLGYTASLAATSLTDYSTGLNYALALTTSNTAMTSATGIGTLDGTGVPSGTQLYVQAYVAAGQAGSTSPVGASDNKLRTLTLTY